MKPYSSITTSRQKHISVITQFLLVLSTVIFVSNTANAAGDAALGEKIFKKCSACHKVGEDAKNGIGPVLNNVFGRTAGTYEKFKYGKAMKAAGAKGLTWDEEQIFTYIANPKKFLRAYLGEARAKAKMKFKLKKEDDRRNVIAYLKTFSKSD